MEHFWLVLSWAPPSWIWLRVYTECSEHAETRSFTRIEQTYVKNPQNNASLEIILRDLKQTRTTTAVNKQLNFTVKNKPHTTNYIYCLFEAYFMIKSVWKNLTVLKSFLSNVYQRREGCRRAEDGKIVTFTSSGRRQPSPRWKVLLKIDFKTVNTVLSQTFNHKYASNMQYI